MAPLMVSGAATGVTTAAPSTRRSTRSTPATSPASRSPGGRRPQMRLDLEAIEREQERRGRVGAPPPGGSAAYGLSPSLFKATPLMVDGLLFVSTPLNQAAAFDAGTGDARWVHDPESVPHPVPWTHICAMPPGTAHTPRAPRSAFDTQASRDARSGCTAPRSRPRRRGRPRGSERFGRGSLAP